MHHYVIMKIIRIETDFIQWIKIIILFYKYVIEDVIIDLAYAKYTHTHVTWIDF